VNVIFGASASTILVVLLVIFAAFMSGSAMLFVRNRVIFKLGIRNLPRRPSQTLLIVIGLMLSTLIIAAAFTIGDTTNHSIRSEVLDVLGPADELVVLSSGSDDETAAALTGGQIPEYVASDLATALDGNPDVDGVMPILSEPVPVTNLRTKLSEPSLLMTGIDPQAVDSFGGLKDLDGKPIDLTLMSGIVLSESAADKLDARIDDGLIVYVGNRPHQLLVKAIAEDSLMTGAIEGRASVGFALPLVRVQTMLEQPSVVSYVAISNRGGVEAGVKHTDAVVAAANTALEGTPYRALPFKRNGLDDAEVQGDMFLQMFLIFGLFSVAVGVLLIFLIFVMLAAERKPEIGMARAVGLKRRQVTEMFLAEGIAYDLGAALIGAVLGIGVAFLMVQILAGIFGDQLEIRPYASWRSLLISYTLGVVVTFLAILVSSWKVSKINITSAIRDVSEPIHKRESRRWLVFGGLGLAIGAIMFWAGASSGNAFALSLGVSLMSLSLAVLVRHFGVPARPVFSVASSLVLLYWLLPSSVSDRFLPETDGGIELFFLSGIMMVASSTMLIIWNAGLITDGLGQLGQVFSRWLPAVKTAIAYPMANRVRTGMTIAMFSLVVFSLVMMAAIMTNVEEIFSGEDAGGGWAIQASQATTNPIVDFRQAMIDNNVDASQAIETSRVVSMPIFRTLVREAGDGEWSTYTINGVDPSFLENSEISLQTRATGYESNQAVLAAMRSDPSLAIVDSFVLPAVGFGSDESQLQFSDIDAGDASMPPTMIEIADPATGRTRTVTVIGILDSKVFTLFGIFLSESTFSDVFSQPQTITYYVQLQPGTDAKAMAASMESGLIGYGIQAQSVREIVDEQMRAQNSFLRLFEGFMGLGLVVGIAAVGVIAFRSVVERRQQIGMLRAIGYQRGMVAASFMIESLMVTLLGVLSGTILGLLLAWNLFTSDFFFDSGGTGFVVPWFDVGLFIIVALAASLLMAYVPARRAARVPIARALRYE
jgi:putative ABC transport system permease protein